MNPCPSSTRRPPVVSWRIQATPVLAFVFTILDGKWHWRADALNARNSAGHASYPAAMAEARAHHFLPAIGLAGDHISAPAKEEAAA